MTTSSPGSTIPSSDAAIASVAPQVTVTCVIGLMARRYQSWYFAANAFGSRAAPQVMAYWLTSSRIARAAASFRTSGQGKLGKPCERLMASCSFASRVIPRITDSVKACVRRAVRMTEKDTALTSLWAGGQFAGSRGARSYGVPQAGVPGPPDGGPRPPAGDLPGRDRPPHSVRARSGRADLSLGFVAVVLRPLHLPRA